MQTTAHAMSSPQLVSVLATTELGGRPRRSPDLAAENRVLSDLVESLAKDPAAMVQGLAGAARELCAGHSAGVTVFNEADEPELCWRAVAGALRVHTGIALPRAFSPCGMALDRDAPQLISQPARHFPFLERVVPAIEEVLVVPFHANSGPRGTVWVAAHDCTRRFDAEDARILATLGKLAAAAEGMIGLRRGAAADGGAAADVTAAPDRRSAPFIALLGHELRGRLAPARLAMELLRNVRLDADKTSSVLEMLDRQLYGMTRIVDDLLEVVRRRGGTMRLRRESVAVADLVERSIETVRSLIAARGHTLAVHIPSEEIRIDGDVMWLSQVLQNLLANAAKYTNPGGNIAVDVGRDGDEVVLTVSDTGVGIEEAHLDGIFGAYVQIAGHDPESSKNGLGLGLHLARMLIAAHGGTIRAASAGLGCGSQLIVRLPVLAGRD